MTTQLAGHGRLGNDPKAIETKSGKPTVVATIAADAGDEEPLWLGLVAFGSQADTRAKHAKGDHVSVSGRIQRRTYTDRQGAEQTQLQLVADSIISARSVQPDTGGQNCGRSDTENARRQADGDVPY